MEISTIARRLATSGRYDSQFFALAFKFALVRHPLARALSAFKYLLDKGTADVTLDPGWQLKTKHISSSDQYISFLEENSARLHQLDYLMRPQVPFVLDEDGNVLVDKLFRLERDMEALNELFQSWGLPRAPHINASRAANIRLNERQTDRILALYAKDLRMYASLPASGSPRGSERALRRPAPGFGDCRTNQDGRPGN